MSGISEVKTNSIQVSSINRYWFFYILVIGNLVCIGTKLKVPRDYKPRAVLPKYDAKRGKIIFVYEYLIEHG